jgi:hypothetical protein
MSAEADAQLAGGFEFGAALLVHADPAAVLLNRLLKNRSDGYRAMQIHYRRQARDAEPTSASQVAYTLRTPLDRSTVSLRVPEIGSSTAC